MIKKTVVAIIVLLGFGWIAASATPISHSLTISATVDAGCTTAAPTGSTGFTISGNSSTFAAAVTGTTQAPASGILTFGTLTCTTSGVKVTLSSARMGLYVDGTQGNSLSKRMNYLATAKLNNTPLTTLDTSQGANPPAGQSSLVTGSNAITISITFPSSTQTLLPQGALTAGTYKDTITIGIDGVTI